MTLLLGVSIARRLIQPQNTFTRQSWMLAIRMLIFLQAGQSFTTNHTEPDKIQFWCILTVFLAHTLRWKEQWLAWQKTKALFWEMFMLPIELNLFSTSLPRKNINHKNIPACCTGESQPLDLTVNAAFKLLLSDCFMEWYAGEVKWQIVEGVSLDKN